MCDDVGMLLLSDVRDEFFCVSMPGDLWGVNLIDTENSVHKLTRQKSACHNWAFSHTTAASQLHHNNTKKAKGKKYQ